MCWARARSLPSAGPVALGKEQWLPSAILCRRPALGEVRACRVPRVCQVPFGWHSAKIMFAECPWSGTRQRPRHSAIIDFPVVATTSPQGQKKNPSVSSSSPDDLTGEVVVFIQWATGGYLSGGGTRRVFDWGYNNPILD